MKIVADMNIPFVKDAFNDFGEVLLVSGREIRNDILKDADILLVRSVTKVNHELLKNTKIKFVATATIGEDHIDKDYLKNNSIGFASAPGSNADSVSEYVFAALMQYKKLKNKNLKDLTLGIIGVGNVGSRVFKRARVFGINTLLNDPPKQRLFKDNIYVLLDKVLSESDIITVHVPLTKDGQDATYQMINNDFISKMKNNAVLFNTSRGRVMSEKAVRECRKKLDFIVLDVWENEPNINIETLDTADIATPHIAGYSYDGKVNGAKMIYESVCSFFSLKKNWQFNGSKEKIELNLIESDDIIFEAVNSCYPIMADVENFRKIKGLSIEKRGNYFDELRKKYPKRLEFKNYKLICSKKSRENDLEILKGLGFTINLK